MTALLLTALEACLTITALGSFSLLLIGVVG